VGAVRKRKFCVPRFVAGNSCFVRRIWAHKISRFVPRPRDVAHPGSGPAQDWLRICSGLLTLRAISGRLRHSMNNYFNSSRASPELVPYIRLLSKRRVRCTQWIMAVAGSCGDHTGDQPRSGDLVHARNHTKDGPLASPESQRTEQLQPSSF